MGLLSRRSADNRTPFGLLLGALLAFLVMVPILDGSRLGTKLLSIGFVMILAAGLGIARQSRRFLAIAVVLILANLVAQWLDLFTEWETARGQFHLTASLLGAAYMTYLVIALARLLLRSTTVSVDTIIGGINVYLLIAITFAQLHSVLEHCSPGAYQQGGVPFDQIANGATFATYLYFSFVTVTTLGYGDVSPVTPGAEFLSIAEAVIGQLYVAILIGGLVALWIGSRALEEAEKIERAE